MRIFHYRRLQVFERMFAASRQQYAGGFYAPPRLHARLPIFTADDVTITLLLLPLAD